MPPVLNLMSKYLNCGNRWNRTTTAKATDLQSAYLTNECIPNFTISIKRGRCGTRTHNSILTELPVFKTDPSSSRLPTV